MILNLVRSAKLSVCVLIIVLFSASAYGEAVKVHVRAILGEGRITANAKKTDSSSTEEIYIDPKINDLRDKLEGLGFSRYRLVSAHRDRLDLNQKINLKLLKGHSLSFRLLSVKNNKAGVWLKWKGPSGMKFIDSRVYFSCDENLITGTDNSHDSGLMLAIKVRPLDSDPQK